jgi:hypothetical protein
MLYTSAAHRLQCTTMLIALSRMGKPGSGHALVLARDPRKRATGPHGCKPWRLPPPPKHILTYPAEHQLLRDLVFTGTPMLISAWQVGAVLQHGAVWCKGDCMKPPGSTLPLPDSSPQPPVSPVDRPWDADWLQICSFGAYQGTPFTTESCRCALQTCYTWHTLAIDCMGTK